MKIDFLNLKSILKDKSFSVVVAAGEDDYLIEKSIFEIKTSLNLDFLELNYNVITEVNSMEQVIESCILVPFMSNKRMVVVKDFVFPRAESEKQKIIDYCKNPCFETCLVFTDKRKQKLDELLSVPLIDCEKLDESVLVKWIVSTVTKSGKRISESCAKLIANYCLNSMSRISAEVSKLIMYCDNEITEDIIVLLVEKENEFVVWELAQEIAVKNSDMALTISQTLITSGEEMTALIGSIYALFRRMFFSKISSFNQTEMATMLGVKSFAIKMARETAEKFSQIQLKKALDFCAKADEDCKGYSGDKGNVFYGLILSLLNV